MGRYDTHWQQIRDNDRTQDPCECEDDHSRCDSLDMDKENDPNERKRRIKRNIRWMNED